MPPLINRITLYQYTDVGARQDLELSKDGKYLHLIDLTDYWGNGWIDTEVTRLPTEVLTRGVKLGGLETKIEQKAEKRWSKSLFRLVKKLSSGEITMVEFKRAIKYKAERHKYPKGQPRLQGGK